MQKQKHLDILVVKKVQEENIEKIQELESRESEFKLTSDYYLRLIKQERKEIALIESIVQTIYGDDRELSDETLIDLLWLIRSADYEDTLCYIIGLKEYPELEERRLSIRFKEKRNEQ